MNASEPTAYRSLAPNASVQKRARNAWHVRALEHLLDHGLERSHDRPVRNVLGRAPDLVALERLAVVRHVLERDRHHVRPAGAAGGQVPHVFLEQFFDVFGEHDSFLLVVFELAFMIAKRMEKTRYPQIYERLINFIARLDIGARKD